MKIPTPINSMQELPIRKLVPEGINIVPITTKAEDSFKLPNKESIQKLVTSKTKAILLSNPGNPTGAVYTKEQMDILRDIAK